MTSAATLSELLPAERHRVIAAQFTDLVTGVTDWAAPAPVEGWTARDVLGHLVQWFPAFVADGCEHSWPSGPSVDQDPAGAWAAQTAGVQALLDDSAIAAGTFAHSYLPAMPLAQAVDQFYTADIFMHSWDLSRASGQDLEIDPAFAGQLLAGMQEMEDVLRSSGQFGEAVPVAANAPVQDRLIAFIGRDPHWSQADSVR